MPTYIDINDYKAFYTFSTTLNRYISELLKNGFIDIIILCIGSDRSTGDCLGPLVGYKLTQFANNKIHVYGCLDKPVHAKNLSETMQKINAVHFKPLIIAIDACLGKLDHIGYITITKGSLKPGSGVGKDLPLVGHISITGIVNMNGFMEFMILQNTRLNIVMKMADLISLGIRHTLYSINSNKEKMPHQTPTTSDSLNLLH